MYDRIIKKRFNCVGNTGSGGILTVIQAIGIQ